MFFFCSHWSLVDAPLIFFCPAHHVPDWQPRILLGMVEARSVNVKKTTTTAWINRVRLPILLVVSSTGKMNISLLAFAPENLVSQDGFDSCVPRQPAHLHTQAESGAYVRDLPSSAAASIYLFKNRHTSSGQSRVYRVTQLRTDGVHCRESASTGTVNLKVVPNECCLNRSPWTN